jgi:pre-mRNA-splicing helicase BRR2
LGSQSEVGLNVDSLTGNLQQDLAILNKADVIVTTAERWDMMSRKWRQRKVIQRVGLYILDQLQILDATYEVVASRIRFMQNEVERKIRIVALSTPLANAKDVANWLGISFPGNTFNFHPSVRPTPLEIHIQGFDHNNKAVRILAMHRPAYNALKKALPSTGSRES